MNKRNLKLYAVPILYVFTVLLLGTTTILVGKYISNHKFKTNEAIEYVDKEIVIDNEYIPVVQTAATIMKPFLIDNITINKTFYNQEDEKSNQENSIIVYKDTYMQNTGVDYKYNEVFDIVSILDGTVIEITDNEALGKTIKIRHNNDLISTYQSLSEITVKENDNVLRGQAIGKSGTCNLYNKDSNLHFEISYQGKNLDPEKSYNKTEDEL